jgi:hypothetical protein
MKTLDGGGKMSGHDNHIIVVGAVMVCENDPRQAGVKRVVVKQESITQKLGEPGVLIDNSMRFTFWVQQDLLPGGLVPGMVVEVQGRLRKPKIAKYKNSEGKSVEDVNITLDVRHPLSIHERESAAERVAKKVLV